MKENKELTKLLKLVVGKWEQIPIGYKEDIRPNKYGEYNGERVKGVKENGHIVLFLIDRQKPSVESSYDFNEERLGVNQYGQIIWGFDSGCSCPSPWNDTYPNCYDVSKSWKEFIVSNIDKIEKEGYNDFFDLKFQEEAINKINEIFDKILTPIENIVKDKLLGKK